MKLDRRYKTHGFTLLELLMVVIIIAILASIALPQYLRVAERSRAAEALTNLAVIRSSELRFKAADPNSIFTQLLGQLDIDVPQFPTGTGNFGTANWDFSVGGTADTDNVIALRLGSGPNAGLTIQMDMTSGNTCTDGPDYQIGAVAAGTSC